MRIAGGPRDGLRAWTAGALLAACTTVAPRAMAVEREHHAGLDLGASVLVVADKGSPDVGAGAGAHWAYGLGDAFNLMVEAAWSFLAIEKGQNGSTPRTRPGWGANADVGLAYVFDVMQWVPYVGLLAGGYTLSGGTIQGTKVLGGAAFALGVDYRFSRSLTAGVALRQHVVTDPADYPSLTQTFLRVDYTWGW